MDDKKRKNQKKILREISIRSKKRRNIFMGIFLFLFCGGYFLFFTSKAWYPDNDNLIKPTKEGSSTSWNGKEITLVNWIYSEEQELMEIQITIENTELSSNQPLEFEALDKKKGYFEVEEFISKDNLYVLRVPVKKGWKEISLRIKDKDENIDPCRIYTNSTKVSRVKRIQDLTADQYLIARIQVRIDGYNKDIYDLQKDIEEMEQDIIAINESIAEYRNKEQYQTAQEIKDTEAMITQAEAEITKLSMSIQENTEMIKEYEERIRLAEEEKRNYE